MDDGNEALKEPDEEIWSELSILGVAILKKKIEASVNEVGS